MYVAAGVCARVVASVRGGVSTVARGSRQCVPRPTRRRGLWLQERKRLQHQVKKQTETSRKAREERRAELEAKLSELRKAIDGVTSQIEALRNVKESESARLAALKGERATLESQAREVEEELDGTAERRRVAEAMDAARAAVRVVVAGCVACVHLACHRRLSFLCAAVV